MGSYTISRRIDATPMAVYRAFTDPGLLADWLDSNAVVDATGPLDATGTTYTLVVRGPWRLSTRVVRSEPGRLHETVGHGPLGAAFRMLATLTPLDGGKATDLVLLTEYTVPLGAIGRWIDRRWLEPGPRTAANREVDRLVDLALGTEAAAPIPDSALAEHPAT
jgi:uncharacterized protein YndB with AHSA1/START domain